MEWLHRFCGAIPLSGIASPVNAIFGSGSHKEPESGRLKAEKVYFKALPYPVDAFCWLLRFRSRIYVKMTPIRGEL